MLVINITIEQLLNAAPVPNPEVKIFRYSKKTIEFQWRWFGKNEQIYRLCHIAHDNEAAEPVLDYCKKRMAELHEIGNH